ncbi:hypothetical protein SO802_001093 [Lithocarpus litseifolius]|uniref:PGG domain-containing protein n=1 Tax=Lithocarpus litseifolius TaxID=425828 RepID=A0AAW2DV66_9ROSI
MARNNIDSNDERARGKLYLAALNGDWNSVKDMTRIQRIITKKKETTLHIAAAANQEKFVKNLLRTMIYNNPYENLTAVNEIGNTALTYAAATGNVNIAMAMLDINSDLPNLHSGVKPLCMAASLGHRKMVELLYSKTKEVVREWEEDEQDDLFITCVEGDLYGVALEMLEDNPNLATARNKDGETVLQLLACNPAAFVGETQPWLNFKQGNSKQSQANKLLENCLQAYKGNVEISQVLFDAAEAGNTEYLIKLIRFDFDLLWKTRSTSKKSIFHIAVENRHESIFNLLNEIGSIGDLIINTKIEDTGNILHLAAGLAPKEKLNAITGAALQMQREILWFKEVEKVVPPAFKEMKNGNGETPYVLFEKTHEELRKKGEKWMKDTSNYSMVVATLIASTMFSGEIANEPKDNPKLFRIFSVSGAIALFSSSTSLVMFLSILTSRYSYKDFLVWLPVRLLIGVATLCISIAAMMVAFFTSFWLNNLNQKELPVTFVVIGLFACAPILYVLLKRRLFVDIVRSTFFWCKPRQRLLYKEVTHEPANPANRTSQEVANLA